MNFFKKIFGKAEAKTPKPNGNVTLEHLLEKLAPYKKQAFVPKTIAVESEFNTASKFGGLPYLRNENDWPVCQNCKKHMQLFLQLNLENLPIKQEQGIIQLFYCTNTAPHCEVDCEAFFPFAKSVVCRKINISQPSAIIKPNIDELFGENKIIGWNAIDDYPHYEELADLGLEINVDDYAVLEEAEIGIPASGDKLFGWPYWVQNVEYPNDRKTQSQMKLLFQIDSEDNLPYMFGDSGVGHITQSPDDPNELAFAWACC